MHNWILAICIKYKCKSGIMSYGLTILLVEKGIKPSGYISTIPKLGMTNRRIIQLNTGSFSGKEPSEITLN